MMLIKVVSAVVLFTAVALTGCSLLSHEAPPEDVDKATGLFLQRLDRNDYDGIYNDLADTFKKNKSRQTVTDSLKELTAYGKVVSWGRIGMNFVGEGKDPMARPVYTTTFEQAAGELTLTYQDVNGEWKLMAFEFKRRR